MRVAILDDYFDTLRGLPCFRLLDGHEVTVWTDHVQDEDTLVKRLESIDALVLFRERTKISGALLDRLPGLKLISQRSVYPHVDVPACTRNGIVLSSNMHAGTPSYAAAEMTWGLVLAGMRQIPQQMRSLQAGAWQMGVGKTLRGRTLGIYGYGRIGRAVAAYGEAFGMDVRFWASDRSRARALADGAKVAESRAAFFSQADVVTLHVRLKPETTGLIMADDLSAMRKDALFVNTSRAGLIAPGALLTALERGRPGQAAIDVFDVEPAHPDTEPLLTHPRVICTPHIGFVTEDEFDMQFTDIFEQINAYAAGTPIHVINPEVIGQTKS